LFAELLAQAYAEAVGGATLGIDMLADTSMRGGTIDMGMMSTSPFRLAGPSWGRES